MPVPLDSIVILGGPELSLRTRAGLRLAQQYPLAALLLSGTPQETATMHTAVQHELPASTRLIEDADSYSTVDNALWVKDVCVQNDFSHLAIVTSSWHMPRTAAIFRWAFVQSPTQLSFFPARGSTPPTKQLKFLEISKWALFCTFPSARTRGRNKLTNSTGQRPHA